MDSRIITRLELIAERLESAWLICQEYQSDGGYAESAGYSCSAMEGSAKQLRDIINEVAEEQSKESICDAWSFD